MECVSPGYSSRQLQLFRSTLERYFRFRQVGSAGTEKTAAFKHFLNAAQVLGGKFPVATDQLNMGIIAICLAINHFRWIDQDIARPGIEFDFSGTDPLRPVNSCTQILFLILSSPVPETFNGTDQAPPDEQVSGYSQTRNSVWPEWHNAHRL